MGLLSHGWERTNNGVGFLLRSGSHYVGEATSGALQAAVGQQGSGAPRVPRCESAAPSRFPARHCFLKLVQFTLAYTEILGELGWVQKLGEIDSGGTQFMGFLFFRWIFKGSQSPRTPQWFTKCAD